MADHHRLPLVRRPEVARPARNAETAADTPPDGGAAEPTGGAADGSVRLLDDARGRRGLMQIGDLAKEAGKTVRAIHLYEELGLITPAARSKGRFRLYAREALLRIRWIGTLQEMGFSLGDIKTIVLEWGRMASAPGAMKRMRAVYARKLEETRDQKRRIAALEAELESSIQYLDACDVCDPQRLLSACSCCDLHDKEAHVPELVLGFRAR